MTYQTVEAMENELDPSEVLRRVNAHEELVTRLKEAEARLRSVNSYLADLCLETIARAEIHQTK